ncbi:GA-binding protein subunit beta-2 isoform X3 [Drosophila pseudoobscura]|uniref:GA-binding protein subunit beta-2 isoform X3 n=1 Tax=Drosophila pseudoobscura pseudoobscura TaxID=46245 RepID=A0A6I8W839_DROPS|nr:GA-binding protein subunit beta-2 isoform X3 [Drosophila pseudoobscura]
MQSQGGPSKVVATLRADGNVYPMDPTEHSNLLHYEIRTEGEHQLKKGNGSGTSTVVDLGKQLLQCARDSDVTGVKTTLAHGAPFASDWLGMSALHFAAMNNQLEICEILLQGGINMDAKTKVDRTPLHLACYYGHERVVRLLLALKCSVNSRDMLRMTPLHWAVEKKHKTIVRMLLKCQADVSLVSKFGKTPIALAVYTEQADVLAELEAARQAQASRKFNEETELKLPSVQRTLEPSMLDEQQQLLNDIISPSSQQAPAVSPATASTLRGQVGTVQTIQLRPSPASGAALGTTSNGVASKAVGNVAKLGAKGASVMPLLTSSEICRQLHDLRRQNEELRRRVDSFHREKEQMLKRIDRLEQLVFIRESEAEIDYLGDL